MKYRIQIFISSPGSNVGHWDTTVWSSDDLEHVKDMARSIAAGNRQNICKVRITETLLELDCVPLSVPSPAEVIQLENKHLEAPVDAKEARLRQELGLIISFVFFAILFLVLGFICR